MVIIGCLIGLIAVVFIANKITAVLTKNKIDDYYQDKYNSELFLTWSPYQSFPTRAEAQEAYQQKVVEMPQLTFERWLTFYNNKPECWVIQRNEMQQCADVPYYVKVNKHEDKRGKIKESLSFVPTYWINAEEKQKYRRWVEEKYEFGDAQIYENARDAKLKELVGYIEEDINDRRKVFEKELEEVKKDITLRLSDGTNVTIPKMDIKKDESISK